MFFRQITHVLAALALWVSATSVQAAGLLRDPDIERGLRELASPILRAAGLSPANVKILVVDDPRLNAFVIDSRHIFLHSGLIMKLESAGQLQAVIAHEAAHIANGHIARRLSNARAAKVATVFGVLVAAAAAAGGEGAAAGGIAAGVTGSANRVFLGHTRVEESSADQSAIRYLSAAKVSPKAMSEVIDIFRGQEALSITRQDPYTRSHPLSRDRVRAVNAYVSASKDHRPSGSYDYWFARAKFKLSAFKRSPRWTLRRAKGNSEIDLLRRAVAEHRQGSSQKATKLMAQLIANRPNDPYFRELQGQILLESRNFNAALSAYKAAANLAPNDALILGGYGRALLTLNTPSSNAQALKVLERARGRDTRDARILRDLGTAYAKAGKTGMAVLSTAERYVLLGDLKNAVVQAKRASGQLPRGSTGWQRAEDILRLAR